MLKFAQSAEYAQKNRVKSLPVPHVMVERSFFSLHYTGSPRFKRPVLYTAIENPIWNYIYPHSFFVSVLIFRKFQKTIIFFSSHKTEYFGTPMMNLDIFFYYKLGASFKFKIFLKLNLIWNKLLENIIISRSNMQFL